jgi:excisionase family DNA binding protein
MTQEWLRVREVAEMLGMPLSSAYLLVHSGELPYSRVSQKTIRVSKAAVIEYMERRAGGKA